MTGRALEGLLRSGLQPYLSFRLAPTCHCDYPTSCHSECNEESFFYISLNHIKLTNLELIAIKRKILRFALDDKSTVMSFRLQGGIFLFYISLNHIKFTNSEFITIKKKDPSLRSGWQGGLWRDCFALGCSLTCHSD